MLFHFVEVSDPILDRPSHPITLEALASPEMQSYIDAMILFAKGEQSDLQRKVLVGLAAPQVGRDIRLILVDLGANGKGQVSNLKPYINPEIIYASEEKEEWYEGCFSTGCVTGIVWRSSTITIRALDRYGTPLEETHTGYIARAFQHEIDHLNGIRFPDRVPKGGLLHLVQKDQMYLYRNQGQWRHWPHTFPQQEWRKIAEE